MKFAELPLHIPLVKIDNFDQWIEEFSNKNREILPNYRSIHERLVALQSKLTVDPINYILNLSKRDNLTDREVADKINSLISKEFNWTPKMIFTLRKQCDILWNDYRNELFEKARAAYTQPTPVQDVVEIYLSRISEIIPDLWIARIQNEEERITKLVLTAGFSSMDYFFSELVAQNLWERPIKTILDALYEKHSIPEWKGNRVWYVYIRNKIRALKIIL